MTATTVPTAGSCRRDATDARAVHDRRAAPAPPPRPARARPLRPGFGGPGFGPGRRAGRGDMRAAILTLLAEEPMHGYQIIQVISERSGGNWTPSPGSVYPTLQQLEDEGLIEPAASETGRRVVRAHRRRAREARPRGERSRPLGGRRLRRRRPDRAPQPRPAGRRRDAAGRPGGHRGPDQGRPGRAAGGPQGHLPAARRGRQRGSSAAGAPADPGVRLAAGRPAHGRSRRSA